MLIDFEKELKKFKPVDPLSAFPDGTPLPDNMQNSIILYNEALEKLESKSEDIAIIVLKKAAALNPDFLEAIYLLGVCYLHMNEYEKAAEMFDKVKGTENNGVQNAKYLDILKDVSGDLLPSAEKKAGAKHTKHSSIDDKKLLENKKQKTAKQPKIARQPNLSLYRYSKLSRDKSGRRVALKFLFAAVILACVVLVGVYLVQNVDYFIDRAGSALNDNNDNASDKTAVEDSGKNEVDLLNEEIANLKNDLAVANNEALYYKNALKIVDARKLASEYKYEAAADILIGLKGFEFKDKEALEFNELSALVMPSAAMAAYSRGYEYFTAGNFQQASVEFEKVRDCGMNWEYSPWAMYNLGVSYKELGRYSDALAVFEDMQKRYPASGGPAEYLPGKIAEIQALLAQER